jgi:hypothetical protein
MRTPAPERLPAELFIAPSLVRQRLSENIIENQYLRRLLRVVEDASIERSVGRFAPPAPDTSGGRQ